MNEACRAAREFVQRLPGCTVTTANIPWPPPWLGWKLSEKSGWVGAGEAAVIPAVDEVTPGAQTCETQMTIGFVETAGVEDGAIR